MPPRETGRAAVPRRGGRGGGRAEGNAADHAETRSDIRIEGSAVGAALVSGDGNVVTIIYGAENLRERRLDTASGVTAPAAPLAVGANPYRGLDAFDETTSELFFGREELTEKLLLSLSELVAPVGAGQIRLLAIMGPSGSGKTSVARAGLVPGLTRTSVSWLRGAEIAVLRPGAGPVDALAAALARLVTGDPTPLAKQREFAGEIRNGALNDRPDALARLAAMRGHADSGPLVVLVDQFEETYTLCRPVDPTDEMHAREKRAERDAFVQTLMYAAGEPGGRVCVVPTLRSDFLGALTEHPPLSKAVAKSHEIIPAMDREDLRRAIAMPANRAGYPLDPNTVERILDETEAGGSATVLPLMQYALFQIWEGIREGNSPAKTLTGLGGVGGALARRADAVMKSLPSDASRALAQRAFLATVQRAKGRVIRAGGPL